MKKKKKKVTIELAPENARHVIVGHVRFDYTKDKYGDAYGPVYVTKEGKKYLLDFDGSIFTLNNKRIKKQSKGFKQ